MSVKHTGNDQETYKLNVNGARLGYGVQMTEEARRSKFCALGHQLVPLE